MVRVLLGGSRFFKPALRVRFPNGSLEFDAAQSLGMTAVATPPMPRKHNQCMRRIEIPENVGRHHVEAPESSLAVQAPVSGTGSGEFDSRGSDSCYIVA